MSPADLAEWRRDEQIARERCGPERFGQAFLKGMEETIDDLVASLLGTASAQL
jgi:hypothetical protein